MDASEFIRFTFVSIVAVEGVVEYVIGRFVEKVEALKPYAWLAFLPGLGMGIFLALHWGLNAATLVGLPDDITGRILTGIVLGRGANGLNFLYDTLKAAVAKYLA